MSHLYIAAWSIVAVNHVIQHFLQAFQRLEDLKYLELIHTIEVIYTMCRGKNFKPLNL